MLKSSSLKTENRGQYKNVYLRMFLFAIIGFIVFFSATWLRLKQIGASEWGYPYAGPPPMMTCLFIGSFGIAIGAIVGLITKGKGKSKK